MNGSFYPRFAQMPQQVMRTSSSERQSFVLLDGTGSASWAGAGAGILRYSLFLFALSGVVVNGVVACTFDMLVVFDAVTYACGFLCF